MPRPPLPARALLVLAVGLGAAGCGGGASTPSSAPSAAPSSSPGAGAPDADGTFFERADSDAVNEVVARAQRSGRRAAAPRQAARCNATIDAGYAAWRPCWHGLLDPYQRDLAAVGDRLGAMADQDLPDACTEELSAGQRRFAGFADRVGGLLEGVDSERRARQVDAMRTYDAVLQRIGGGYAPYFQQLTRACYSPQDLASIDADAAAGASPSTPPRD